nr:hypothetical protein WG33_0138 [uncultured bacterium]
MFIRLYFIDELGELDTRTSNRFGSAIAYVSNNRRDFPLRQYLAWDRDQSRHRPESKGERIQHCQEAIDASNTLSPDAQQLLDVVSGKAAAVLTDSEILALVNPEPGPRKPPRTMIVQEWAERINREEPSEIARRAWEATMALCKGG